jgi:hypothetical protein
MSFEIFECLFSPFGFLFVSLDLGAKGTAVILRLNQTSL